MSSATADPRRFVLGVDVEIEEATRKVAEFGRESNRAMNDAANSAQVAATKMETSAKASATALDAATESARKLSTATEDVKRKADGAGQSTEGLATGLVSLGRVAQAAGAPVGNLVSTLARFGVTPQGLAITALVGAITIAWSKHTEEAEKAAKALADYEQRIEDIGRAIDRARLERISALTGTPVESLQKQERLQTLDEEIAKLQSQLDPKLQNLTRQQSIGAAGGNLFGLAEIGLTPEITKLSEALATLRTERNKLAEEVRRAGEAAAAQYDANLARSASESVGSAYFSELDADAARRAAAMMGESPNGAAESSQLAAILKAEREAAAREREAASRRDAELAMQSVIAMQRDTSRQYDALMGENPSPLTPGQARDLEKYREAWTTATDKIAEAELSARERVEVETLRGAEQTAEAQVVVFRASFRRILAEAEALGIDTTSLREQIEAGSAAIREADARQKARDSKAEIDKKEAARVEEFASIGRGAADSMVSAMETAIRERRLDGFFASFQQSMEGAIVQAFLAATVKKPLEDAFAEVTKAIGSAFAGGMSGGGSSAGAGAGSFAGSEATGSAASQVAASAGSAKMADRSIAVVVDMTGRADDIARMMSADGTRVIVDRSQRGRGASVRRGA